MRKDKSQASPNNTTADGYTERNVYDKDRQRAEADKYPCRDKEGVKESCTNRNQQKTTNPIIQKLNKQSRNIPMFEICIGVLIYSVRVAGKFFKR